MKLRFHSDSLRLRLSQSEVARLSEEGRIEDTVHFAPGQILSYILESGPEPSILATYSANRIRVVLPAAKARRWIESDEPGVEGSAGRLRVLIEKDFQCLHPSVEEPDAFPNPLAKKG
jgi:Family of unknown function (DUF7009)